MLQLGWTKKQQKLWLCEILCVDYRRDRHHQIRIWKTNITRHIFIVCWLFLYFTDDSQIKEIDRASGCWATLANWRGNFEYIRRFSVESRRHGLALRISTDIWFPFSRACCICVRDFEAVNSHLFLYSFIDWFFIIFFHFNKIVKIIDEIKFGKASYRQIYLC